MFLKRCSSSTHHFSVLATSDIHEKKNSECWLAQSASIYPKEYRKLKLKFSCNIKSIWHLACVANVSVGLGSKESQRNGIFGVLPARKVMRESFSRGQNTQWPNVLLLLSEKLKISGNAQHRESNTVYCILYNIRWFFAEKLTSSFDVFRVRCSLIIHIHMKSNTFLLWHWRKFRIWCYFDQHLIRLLR